MTPEGQLKADCRKIAKQHGLVFWNIEGKMCNGVPDTVCGKVGGGIVFVEFKRPGATPTEQQYKRMREINQAGGEATWVDSLIKWRIAIGLS